MTKIFVFVALAVFVNFLDAQPIEDRTIFTITPENFCRYATSTKDQELFLPKYEDIAKDPATQKLRDVTLQVWQSNLLSAELFLLLDKDKSDIISKEELDEDRFMGDVQLQQQTLDGLGKEYPDYQQRLQRLARNPYKKPETVKEFYVPKTEVSEASLIPTKTYITLHHGHVMEKQVDLLSYTSYLLQEQRAAESKTLHIGFFAFIIMTGIITFILLNSTRNAYQGVM